MRPSTPQYQAPGQRAPHRCLLARLAFQNTSRLLIGLVLALPCMGQADPQEILKEIRSKGDQAPIKLYDRLGRIGTSASFDALGKAVRELRAQRSLDAAYGAYRHFKGEIRSEAIETLFKEARTNKRKANRHAATRGLGQFGEEASGPLRNLLTKNRDDEVRRIAAQPILSTLAHEGTRESVELILDWGEVKARGQAARTEAALRECKGEEAEAALVQRLGRRSTEEAWRLMLVKVIATREGSEIQEALVGALEDESESVRIQALQALANRGDEGTRAAVHGRLRTKSPAEIVEVVEALGRLSFGLPDWPEELLELSRSKDVAYRLGATRALLELRTPAAITRLHELLADEDWRVRTAAAQEVGNLRRKASVPLLIERLDLEAGRLSRDLAACLRLVTGQDHGPRSARWKAWWEAEGSTYVLPPYEEALAAENLRIERRANNPTVVTFYGLEVVSERVTFVLDVSGSMSASAGAGSRTRAGGPPSGGPTRIDVAKTELVRALGGLSEGTLFNLVFFNSGVAPWKDGLVAAGEKAMESALQFTRIQEASGGTNLFDALMLAFEEERVDTIYLLSDGAPSAGRVTDPDAILERIHLLNRARMIQINTISIGQKSPFMRRLAEENGGSYTEKL